MVDPLEGPRFRKLSGILGYWKDTLLTTVPVIGVISVLNPFLYCLITPNSGNCQKFYEKRENI